MCRFKTMSQRNNKVKEDITELEEARKERLRLLNGKGESTVLPVTPE